MKLRKTITFISTTTFIVIFLTLPLAASAAFEWWDKGGPKGMGGTLGLAEKDIDLVVIEVIKWVLGITGLISVIMVIYGGLTWLTSAGNEEKVKKAKKVLSAAIIGLVVIFLSWAILTYVASIISLAVLPPE